MVINTRQYKYFLAVLEELSILRASKKLNISQPALSKSILAMEELFGFPLFERLARGVKPTTYGLTLERHARRIIHDVNEAHSELSEVARGAKGRISLGTGSSFVSVVSETVQSFLGQESEVDFVVQVDRAGHLFNALMDNRIDFFVGMYNEIEDDPAFNIDPLYQDQFVCICNFDHPFAGKEISSEEAHNLVWIVSDLEEHARLILDAYFMFHLHKRPRFRIATNADKIVADFLKGTNYVGLISETDLRSSQFSHLTKFDLSSFRSYRKIGLVSRKNFLQTPLMQLFVGMLMKKLEVLKEEIESSRTI